MVEPHESEPWWDVNTVVLMAAADRTLGSVLRRLRETEANWVVIVRASTSLVYYYAYLTTELEGIAADRPDLTLQPLDLALELNKEKASATTRGKRAFGVPSGTTGLAAARVIEFDTAGRVAAIGVDRETFWRFYAGDNGDEGDKGDEA